MRRFLFMLPLLVSFATAWADPSVAASEQHQQPTAQILSHNIQDPLLLSLCLPLPAEQVKDIQTHATPLTLKSVTPQKTEAHHSCYLLHFQQGLNTHVVMLSLAYQNLIDHKTAHVDLVLDMMTHTVSVIPNEDHMPTAIAMSPDKTSASPTLNGTMNAVDQADEPQFEAALIAEDRTLPGKTIPVSAHPTISHTRTFPIPGETIVIHLLKEQNMLLKAMNHKLDLLLKK